MRNKTPEQLAKALGVSVSTIRYQARRGQLPHDLTPGGHRRFDIDEVKVQLAQRRPQAAPSGLTAEPLELGDPLEPSPEFARAQLNESSVLFLTATAGGVESDPVDTEWHAVADPFEAFAVPGAVRYPQQTHGVGAGA